MQKILLQSCLGYIFNAHEVFTSKLMSENCFLRFYDETDIKVDAMSHDSGETFVLVQQKLLNNRCLCSPSLKLIVWRKRSDLFSFRHKIFAHLCF